MKDVAKRFKRKKKKVCVCVGGGVEISLFIVPSDEDYIKDMFG